MTMPPAGGPIPSAPGPWFAALRDLRDRLAPAWRGRHEFDAASHGHEPGLRRRSAGGGHDRAAGWRPTRAVEFSAHGPERSVELDPGLLRSARGGLGGRVRRGRHPPPTRIWSRSTASGRTCAACRRGAGPGSDFDDIFSEEAPAARPDPRRPQRRRPAAQNGHRSRRTGVAGRPEELQRRPEGGRQAQGRRAGDHQLPERRPRAGQAPRRLRERPHLRPGRLDAARGRPRLPADAAARSRCRPRTRRS